MLGLDPSKLDVETGCPKPAGWLGGVTNPAGVIILAVIGGRFMGTTGWIGAVTGMMLCGDMPMTGCTSGCIG